MELLKDIFIPILSIFVSVITAYLTAKHAFRREYQNGKIQLLEIVIRYFITFVNVFDKKTKKILENEIDKKMYINELDQIQMDLSKLISNPFFISIIKQFPDITKLQIYIRRELIHLKTESAFSVQQETAQYFSKIYDLVKRELPKKYFLKNGLLKEIDSVQKVLDERCGKNKLTSPNSE